MTITDEIVGLEKQYWDALKTKNVDEAVSLTKFPCLLAGPMGAQRIEEKEYREMMKSDYGSKYEGVELENTDVELLNRDTAIITYNCEVNGMKMLDVSTWVRENGKWACAFHAENPMQH